MTTPAATARILVVANRTASTPLLLDEIARQSGAGTQFTVLIPTHDGDASDDWAPDVACRLCGTAAGGDVAMLACGHKPLDTIHAAVDAGDFDAIIVSTAPEHLATWVHHDLPHRVKHLGLPVTVISHDPATPVPDHVKAGLPDDWDYSHRPLVEGLGANG